MWYVKESNSIEEGLESKQLRFPKIIRKLIYSYKCIFHKTIIRQIENGYIYLIPVNLKKEKINKKVIIKMLKVFKKYNVKSVAISKYFEKNENFKNNIYKQNIHILNGRNLFNILSIDCLKYIAEKLETNLENLEVTILVNDITDINIDNIRLISQSSKAVSVVSNNINKLKTISEQIYEQTGTLIKFSNNTKKSLSRAKLILNIDFSEELLNKYNVYNKSILLNICDNVKINKKSFNGITIQYFDCNLPLKYITGFKDYRLYDYFDRVILCESIICLKDTFYNLRKKIERESIQINKLIGSKTYISDSEFKKSIDKSK